MSGPPPPPVTPPAGYFFVQYWAPPPDSGSTHTQRDYYSPAIGPGWSNLYIILEYNTEWPGGFGITGEAGEWWNRVSQGASPVAGGDPFTSYVTTTTDTMHWFTNGIQSNILTQWWLYAGKSSGTTAPCPYGTELQPSAPATIILTEGVIAAVLSLVDAEFLAPVFAALLYQTVNLQTLCSMPPPPMPDVGLGLLNDPVTTIQQLLYALMWPSYCQCAPGSPPPSPYPLPAPTQPPGWPTQPTFPCADTDVCAAIVAIQGQVAAINATVGEVLQLVTLLQRYGLPFAYVKGAVHSSVSGTGSFAISRLLGVGVVVTEAPESPRTSPGNPPYIFDLGWISMMTGDGLILERRISQTSFAWLPSGFQDALIFGYYCNSGVQIQVTELEAEV